MRSVKYVGQMDNIATVDGLRALIEQIQQYTPAWEAVTPTVRMRLLHSRAISCMDSIGST